MKETGIWIDKKNAKIFTLSEKEEKFEVIPSNLKFLGHTGFSRAHMKWGGPQNVLAAKTIEEREKNQLNKYFDEVIKTIKKVDAIAVFGTAQTPRLFTHRLQVKNKTLWTRLKTVEKADKLTDNQFQAMVRNFYTAEKRTVK